MSGGACQCGGQCGCAARQLETEWFKTGRSITKSLSANLMPLEPHVKGWSAFLKLASWYLGASLFQTEGWKVLKGSSLDWVEVTAWGRQRGGTSYYDPPEYDETYVQLPTKMEFTVSGYLDLSKFEKGFVNELRAAITDVKGFKTALRGILADKSSMTAIAKMLQDRIKFFFRSDELPDLLASGNSKAEDEIGDWWADEKTDGLDGHTLVSEPHLDLYDGDLKYKKVWSKLSGRKIEFFIVFEHGVEGSDYAAEIDYDFHRYAALQSAWFRTGPSQPKRAS